MCKAMNTGLHVEHQDRGWVGEKQAGRLPGPQAGGLKPRLRS